MIIMTFRDMFFLSIHSLTDGVCLDIDAISEFQVSLVYKFGLYNRMWFHFALSTQHASQFAPQQLFLYTANECKH